MVNNIMASKEKVTPKTTKKVVETSKEKSSIEDKKSVETKTTANKDVAKAGKRSEKAIKENAEKIAKEERKISHEVNSEPVVKKSSVKPTRPKVERKSKKYQVVAKSIDKTKLYNLDEAIALAKETSYVKFDASLELHLNLNIDPRHADQNLRDTLVLPAGTGKKLTVAVLSDDNEAAKSSGADIFGTDNIFSLLDKNQIKFDVLIASPTQMAKLGKYARLLGPRGLMPNPKSGTVTNDIAKAVKEAKAGKIEYRVDSTGIVHAAVGKVSFKKEDLVENANTLIASIKTNKPQSVKSNYLKAIYVTTTMGPSIKLDISTL